MARISIPAKQLKTFIESANKWLTKTSEFKFGLDLALSIENGICSLSTGSDSNFIKVTFNLNDPELNLDRMFLDLSYISKLNLDVEFPVILSPPSSSAKEVKATDRRLSVSHKHMNFKIPLKVGDIWQKNYHDFNKHPVDSYVEIKGRDVFKVLYSEIVLPASFGVKGQQQICFHKKPDKKGVFAYSEDSFGAFCHQFIGDTIHFSEGVTKLDFIYEFLTPIVKFEEMGDFRIYSTDRYILGSVQSTVFETFHWVQPRLNRPIDDIEELMSEASKDPKEFLHLNTQEFASKIKDTIIFFNATNFKDTPVQLMCLEGKYSLSANLPSAESLVEGDLLKPTPNGVRVFFQAAALRDYIDMLDKDKPCVLEVYRNKVFVTQTTEQVVLNYLMPIHER